VERETQRYDRWHLIVALAYGGRDEILRAIRRWYNDPERVSPEELTEEIFSSYLDTKGIPEPDLLIRTSMEQRISNFLLWQCAYTEFVFVEDYWPDFNGELFKKILHIYARRERRFGDIAPSPSR
jgi:undecaprenyl diphosphate synthase